MPDLVGIPLVIQDKTFVASNILTQDPTWQWGKQSDLWYPHVYESNQGGGTGPNTCPTNPPSSGRWDYGPCVSPPAILPGSSFYTLPNPASVVAEAFLDTTLVNGGVYPTVSVPPRRVRFRMLNGCQARFYHLNLYVENPPGSGEVTTGFLSTGQPDPSNTTPGPIMYQVGTEGGFLPAVAIHDNTTPIPLDPTDSTGNTANPDGPFNLLLAPAERADVVIDFNGIAPNTSFILYGDAPAPFPGGDPRNDYFTGDPDFTNATNNTYGLSGGALPTLAGHGPNTRTLLKIVVTSGSGDSVATSTWLGLLNTQLKTNFLTGNQPGLLYNNSDPSVPGPVPYLRRVHRQLTLE